MKQEEMQFVGAFGIYTEAYIIIFSWRKIFSQIALVLVLPLCIIFLLDAKVSLTLSKLTTTYSRLIFKAAYSSFLLIFSLLLTSVVAYTIACVHDGLEASFKKVMTIIPKVWKRVMITTLCTIIAMVLYIVVAFGILHPFALFLSSSGHFAISKIRVVLAVFIMLGLAYLSIVWQLAGVVSVLEDAQGIRAMIKSMELTKEKMSTAFLIFTSHFVLSFLLQLIIKKLFERGGSFEKVVFGVLCFVFLVNLILASHTTQTVFYFVCKSYHPENVDEKSFLLSEDDLRVIYVEEEQFFPLKSNDVQK